MPLPQYGEFHSVWVEKTKSSHGHGGEGWEFGTCLWSPTTNKSDQRIYGNMEAVREGDLVLHFYEDTPFGRREDHYFCGYSIAAGGTVVRTDQPPLPGDWGNRASYFRIPLRDFVPFNDPIAVSDFVKANRNELVGAIASSKDSPFILYRDEVRLAQGKYLSHCPHELFDLLSAEVADTPHPLTTKATSKSSKLPRFDYEVYVEGQRAKREANYFVRNPQLIRDAKAHFGAKCQACNFEFLTRYGDLGADYIEIHHLNPLSERVDAAGDPKLSSLKQVSALCANCHRMIHRLIRKFGRAVSLEEFRAHIQFEL